MWIYAGLLFACLAAGAVVCWYWVDHRPDWGGLSVLLGLALVAKFLRTSRSQQNLSVSFSSIILAAAVALSGPVGAAIVGFFPAWMQRTKLPLVSRASNAVMNGLIGLSGGVAYIVVGGQLEIDGAASTSELVFHVLMPLIGANVVMLAVNAPLVSGVIRITAATPLLVSIIAVVRSAWLTYLGYGLVAFLFVVLWEVEGLGPVSVLLVLAPLALAQWSIHQQMEEQDAHYRTISTLIAAVEARDPSTQGRAEYVAQVCEVLGQEMRLRPRQLQALRFASALHNIGLIAPVAREERGQGRLTDASRMRLLEHPARGVEMIRHIDFLDESTPAIRHHHERWDGLGYPDGLSHDEIPLLARILAVADTFAWVSADTRDLAGRDAVAHLQTRSGSHLDPDCVSALSRVVERGRVPDASALAVGAPELDHDDPDISDQLASFAANGAGVI